MFVLRAIKSQVESFLREISKLEASEFPYPHSREALQVIRRLFEDNQFALEILTSEIDPSIVSLLCNNAAGLVRESSEILGFLLRSTNIRNAFESYGPLLRLCQKVLGPETRLIISSEWSFSPFNFVGFDPLESFVRIGLPATESANPFLLPLAGHELGHSVWKSRNLDSLVEPKILQSVLNLKNERQEDYNRLFYGGQHVQESEIETRRNVSPALEWARGQLEEVFCDLMGLRLFSEAYLYSFADMIAPFQAFRTVFYPNNEDRANVLVKMSNAWKIDVPSGYQSWFIAVPSQEQGSRQFLLSLADSARMALVEMITREVERALDGISYNPRNADAVKDCLESLKIMVPIQKATGLSDILNAGWAAKQTESFFKEDNYNENADQNLKELLLKSFEVLEYECKLGETTE